MASHSMHALLSVTLAGCSVRGTKVTESGLTVSTDTLPGETILFFKTDSATGRQCLGIVEENLKACDYLVLYSKKDNRAEIICFLELKGSDLKHATDQIINTYNHPKILAEGEIEKSRLSQITWKVSICMKSHPPSNDQHSRDRLAKVFKQHVRIRHGIKHDKLLGSFLRG